jgi:HPt (histidine-containing phosphotransfer) domain-containing protein
MVMLIDRAALSAQTFADPALEAEILTMFREQAPPLIAALRAAEGLARAELAHRIKGSALAIGATGLAEAAGAAEASPSDMAVDKVETSCAAVLLEVRQLLASAAEDRGE